MASQITNYKCPACTGPLHFVGASGKLECDFCGAKYDVAQIEALYAEKEAKAVAATEQANAKAEQNRQKMVEMESQGWDTSSLSSDWGAEADGMKKAVLALLPVYDDLARALDAPCTDEAYYHGVELLMQKLLARLDGLGVVPMDSLGKCFNPDYHEAVEHIEDPAKRQDEIVQVIQTGFTMDDEIIRHAKVVVAN